MEKDLRNINGLQLLHNKYKDIFRIPENLNHYSKEDFRIAERKFLKWMLNGDESSIKRQEDDCHRCENPILCRPRTKLYPLWRLPLAPRHRRGGPF